MTIMRAASILWLADPDEAARAFQFDGARHSEMMPSTVWRLAGW
jgi:hypothetical protein